VQTSSTSLLGEKNCSLFENVTLLAEHIILSAQPLQLSNNIFISTRIWLAIHAITAVTGSARQRRQPDPQIIRNLTPRAPAAMQ
jgi:hypothetical protein